MVHITIWNDGELEHRETVTFKRVMDFLKRFSSVEKVVIYHRWTDPLVKIIEGDYIYNFKVTTGQLKKMMDFLVELNNGEEIEERTF